MVRLNELDDLEAGVVVRLFATGDMKRRLQDLGVVEGTCIKRLRTSPLGDPASYLIRGAVIAIRSCDAYLIGVETVKWDSHLPR